MTEFEKVALHYLAYQSALLRAIANNAGNVRGEYLYHIEQRLKRDIRKVASPGTLEMLDDSASKSTEA